MDENKEKIKNALLGFAEALGSNSEVIRKTKKENIIFEFGSPGDISPNEPSASVSTLLSEYANSLDTLDSDGRSVTRDNVVSAFTTSLPEEDPPEVRQGKSDMLAEYLDGIDSLYTGNRKKSNVTAENPLTEEMQQYVDNKIDNVSRQIGLMRSESGTGSNGGGGTVAKQYIEGGTLEGNVQILGRYKPEIDYRAPDAINLLYEPAFSVRQYSAGNESIASLYDADDLKVDVHHDGNTVLYESLSVIKNTFIGGDLRVAGNAYLSAGVDGIINVGDADTDNVVFNADVNSNFIPNLHHTYDLGMDTRRWDTLYIRDIVGANNLNVGSNSALSGDLVVYGEATFKGPLSADNLWLHGNLRADRGTFVHGLTSGGNNLLTRAVIEDELTVDGEVELKDELIVHKQAAFGDIVYVVSKFIAASASHMIGPMSAYDAFHGYGPLSAYDEVHALSSLDVTGSFTASDIQYPIADGIDGDILTTDGNNTLAFSSLTGEINNQSTVTIKELKIDGSTVPAPGSATDPGIVGTIKLTDTHLYVCTGVDQWKRVLLETW